MYLLIKERQHEFYRCILQIINHTPESDIANARKLRQQLYALYNSKVNEIFRGLSETDIDYSGIMNLMRELEISNELMLSCAETIMIKH